MPLERIEDKKITILTISDSVLSPSGVGTQAGYIFKHLVETGRYKVISLGGALKHMDYTPVKIEPYGDDWVQFPIDGYGNQEIIRSMLQFHKPDILWFMTDPRFYEWLWDIEDEVRPNVPMVYYHVWDNYPYPKYNKPFYDSTDVVVSISKLTDDVVKTLSPDVPCLYIPHSVDFNFFKKQPDNVVESFKKEHFKDERMLFFFNSRNARRKNTGSLIWWFKEFLDEVGHDKARLLLHTDPKDPNGPNLEAIVHELGLTNGEVMFSTAKLPPNELALLYNAADCTINISDAEGFGLSCMESLACETPAIVTMTGGLQEQITDGKEWFGCGIEPASKSVIGSQQVPYIYEDRISKEDFIQALKKMLNLSKEERDMLGKKGRQHLEKNYNAKTLLPKWDELFTTLHNEKGSWENRKGYERWTLKEIK